MKIQHFYLFILLPFILGSCGQNSENKQDSENLNITVDSTIVDAKGQIIDVKYGLNTYDFNQDKSLMYKFNTNNRHGLEVIDLNKMELVEFIPFQIEGPQGTTSRVVDITYISDSLFAIENSKSILFFNRQAELQKQYNISRIEFAGDSLPNDYSMEKTGTYIPKENMSFNIINEGFGFVRGFAKIDLEKEERKAFLIDELEKLDEYHIQLTVGDRIMMLRTYIFTLFSKGKYLLSSDMVNEVFIYDEKVDSITHKKYSSEITPNKNEVFGKMDLESREETSKIMTERNKSIRFKSFVYDEERNQYYRFSTISESVDPKVEEWNIILTIFDEDLNQLKEVPNIPLEEVPSTYFVKDGKIYIYKNMEDELGFKILNIYN